jgi:hypothetical protein
VPPWKRDVDDDGRWISGEVESCAKKNFTVKKYMGK